MRRRPKLYGTVEYLIVLQEGAKARLVLLRSNRHPMLSPPSLLRTRRASLELLPPVRGHDYADLYAHHQRGVTCCSAHRLVKEYSHFDRSLS